MCTGLHGVRICTRGASGKGRGAHIEGSICGFLSPGKGGSAYRGGNLGFSGGARGPFRWFIITLDVLGA